MTAESLKFGPYTIKLSSLDKLYYPESGITKGDVIEYYQRIAATMMPYLEGRPDTLHRFPNGIGEEGFFQKQASDYFPDWITTVTVEKEGGEITHVIVDKAASLVYLTNQGTITHHTWLSKIGDPDCPDRLIFDLDPSASGFEVVRFAARAFREVVEEIGLVPFLMATGSRGLHVTIPLDASTDFDTVRRFARDLAQVMARRYPDRLTVQHRKTKRAKRLFLDTARNAYAQTGVTPYSLRAKPGAPVAAPLHWEELDEPNLTSQKYSVHTIFARLESDGDPWKGMGRRARRLEEPRRALDALIAEE